MQLSSFQLKAMLKNDWNVKPL